MQPWKRAGASAEPLVGLMEAQALEEPAAALGLAVVSMDRAGVGLSDGMARGMSVQSVADDAHLLARHLKMEHIVVIGTSGGGPYAAAFAATHADLVQALVLVAAVAPTNLANLPLLGAMRGADFIQLGLVRLPPLGGLWGLHSLLSYMAKHHLNVLLEHAPKGMAAADGAVLREDPRVRDAFGKCLRHAYCRTSRGVARDVRVLGGRWGIDFSAIKCRVMIWQGADDLSVPVKHAEWWAGKLPQAKLNILPGEGHVTVLLKHGGAILEQALHWQPAQAGAGAGAGAAAGAAVGAEGKQQAQPARAAEAGQRVEAAREEEARPASPQAQQAQQPGQQQHVEQHPL
ncbi:hypothetical protein ABPG75_003833 [Micractinium tetrahymenae]